MCMYVFPKRAGVTVMGKHRYAASSNGIGGVGHADEVGVFDFDSASLDSSSSCHSDDGVSHISIVRGSLIIKSGYERAVHNFGGLENQWLNEADSLQQQTLYKSIFEAEVAFAVKFGIYSHLITGNQKEVSVAKDKTRNRMRTRLKNKCCIGLPVQGRALKREKTRKKFECVLILRRDKWYHGQPFNSGTKRKCSMILSNCGRTFHV